MVMGAPLEDARHLAQRYDRMRQDAEAQVFDDCLIFIFRKLKLREQRQEGGQKMIDLLYIC